MDEQDIGKRVKAKEIRNNIIVIILSLLLVAVAVMYFFQRKEHQQIVSELNVEKETIKKELSALVVRYDSLETENDTINTQLSSAQSKVKDLLIEVEQTKKISLEKINAYQKQVNTLRGIMRDFVVQIDSLNRRNQELMAENLEVKEQFKRVETEKEQLSMEKEKLEQNLQRAAVLSVRDLLVEPLNQRNRETRFADRTERIRIYFIINENVSARRGTKNIYARIMRPDQLLMQIGRSSFPV